MKKKLISLLLTGALATSMAAVATAGVSAAVVDGRYQPSEDTETYRYYFYMPESWENEMSTEAGIYWWTGTDACGAVDGTGGTTAWPGYLAQKGDAENIFYVDCPTDVANIVWNNHIDGGEDTTTLQYSLATQTFDVPSEYYDIGESVLYPDGTDSFDNMIYVLDPAKVTVNELSGKVSYGGEWYYYYGNGEYGTYPTKEEAEAADAVLNTEYNPPLGEGETLPTVTVPSNSSNTQDTTNADQTTNPGSTANPGQPSTDATSSTSGANSTSSADSASTSSSNNSAVQTGSASLAVILLTILSAVCGVVVVSRKKFD